MLYTVAFAFGGTPRQNWWSSRSCWQRVPLFFRVGRRAGPQRSDVAGGCGLLFLRPGGGRRPGPLRTPMRPGVFFTLAAFYLLLVWRDAGDSRYLAAAGAVAGFCYAIKTARALTVAAPASVRAGRSAVRKARPAGGRMRCVGDRALAGPQPGADGQSRSAVWRTACFRTPISTSPRNAIWLASLALARTWCAPPAFRGNWHLATGFREPSARSSLPCPWDSSLSRQSRGTLVLGGGGDSSGLPWFSNTGARFLMPARGVGRLHRRHGVAAARPPGRRSRLQAVLCWPQVIDLWQTGYAFRLHEFPLAAALRIEPEPTYLKRHLDEYTVAQDDRGENAAGCQDPRADRRGQRLPGPRRARHLAIGRIRSSAGFASPGTRVDRSARRVERQLGHRNRCRRSGSGCRPRAGPSARSTRCGSTRARTWCIPARTGNYAPGRTVGNRRWRFDDNLATGWRTWSRFAPACISKSGSITCRRSRPPSSYSPSPGHGLSLEVYGQSAKRRWHALGAAQARPHPPGDLRLDASLAIRRAGYRYVLAATGGGGSTPVGNALVGHESDWGMERVAGSGPIIFTA